MTETLSDPFVMRLAEPADKEAVVRLARAIDPEDYIPEMFDHAVAGQWLYVAEQAGRVIGCHAFEWPQPDQQYLFAMRIDPAMQGKGIGSAYCRAQLELAKQAGARQVWLTSLVTNLPAHRTVEKNGFVKRGEWIAHDQLPVEMLPAGPTRARAGRPSDLALLAPFRALFLGDVMASTDGAYAVASTVDSDWRVEELVVVDGEEGALAGAMLLREIEWDDQLYIRRLEGTPEAALELLKHAGAEAQRRGKKLWTVSLPARAEHLLAPTGVDPTKAFRVFAFQYIVSAE